MYGLAKHTKIAHLGEELKFSCCKKVGNFCVNLEKHTKIAHFKKCLKSHFGGQFLCQFGKTHKYCPLQNVTAHRRMPPHAAARTLLQTLCTSILWFLMLHAHYMPHCRRHGYHSRTLSLKNRRECPTATINIMTTKF